MTPGLAYKHRKPGEQLATRLWNSYEIRILALFSISLAFYAIIARWIYTPTGYYAHFSDPWFERTEAIISGKLLYKDVFTTTPPLTNYLLVPPSLIARLFNYQNPGATVAFMLYFAFFNLLSAYVLFYMSASRPAGWHAAAFFLLNPLTLGNAVLRRQDEAILVFFLGLSLFFLSKQRPVQAAFSMGLTLLVKLWGLILLPIAFLHTRDWKLLVIPVLVFAIVFAPFLITAGQSAFIWNPGTFNAEHPFQLDGISLGALWVRWQGTGQEVILPLMVILLCVGVCTASALVLWKQPGVLEDLSILISIILLLSPKLHAGYFALLAFTLSPLLKPYRLKTQYFLMGALVIILDFYKYPLRNYPVSIALLGMVSILLITVIVSLFRKHPKPEADQDNLTSG
jgi:hypothetical protein